MRERLAGLGFAEVEVINEDLGCSTADGTPYARTSTPADVIDPRSDVATES